MSQFDPEAGPETPAERFDEVVSLLQCSMLAIDDSHGRCDHDDCPICPTRDSLQNWLRRNKRELVDPADYFPEEVKQVKDTISAGTVAQNALSDEGKKPAPEVENG